MINSNLERLNASQMRRDHLTEGFLSWGIVVLAIFCGVFLGLLISYDPIGWLAAH